ncbi:MAG: hypothetical protein KDD60_11415, partial [Bdellovibrionales bacterium]|nr:hypothetical protein [Bdellovibrionales bacterium]
PEAERFRQYIESPVLTGIEVNFGAFQAYDVEPATIPDVFAQRPVVLYGKWKGDPEGVIEVHGKSGSKDYSQKFDVSDVIFDESNKALRYLWARNRIQTLSDFAAFQGAMQTKEAITELGLRYSLLTKYTSFVAVDDVVRNKDGELIEVKQPLPLPKGVSNFAVGGMIPTTPEPEMYLLLLVLCGGCIWWGMQHRRTPQGGRS